MGCRTFGASMNKLLALACVVVLVSACAGFSRTGDAKTASAGAGAAEAATLGYHGPVHRLRGQYGD
jgi:hypothetical protein